MLPSCRLQQLFSGREVIPWMTPHLNWGILGWHNGNHHCPLISSILLKFNINIIFHVQDRIVLHNHFTLSEFVEDPYTSRHLFQQCLHRTVPNSQRPMHPLSTFSKCAMHVGTTFNLFFVQRKNSPKGINNHHHQSTVGHQLQTMT